jgi:hypothetical protein
MSVPAYRGRSHRLSHSKIRRVHNQRFVIRVTEQAGKLCPLVLGASYSEGQCPSVFIVYRRTRPVMLIQFHKLCFPRLAFPRALPSYGNPMTEGVRKYVNTSYAPRALKEPSVPVSHRWHRGRFKLGEASRLSAQFESNCVRFDVRRAHSSRSETCLRICIIYRDARVPICLKLLPNRLCDESFSFAVERDGGRAYATVRSMRVGTSDRYISMNAGRSDLVHRANTPQRESAAPTPVG